MDRVEELVQALKKRHTAIIFGSFLHGSGRSFLADKLAKALEERGVKVARISAGQVFRELAKKNGESIEEFVDKLTRDRDLAMQIDLQIDKEIKRRIEAGVRDMAVVIVDSNLAPFYAKGIRVLVRTDPRIAGERVYKGKRESDEEFSSPEEARRALEKRTSEDLKRYRELARSDNVPEEWRRVYEKAVESWGDESIFDIIIDNSGPAEESLKQLLKALSKILSTSTNPWNAKQLL